MSLELTVRGEGLDMSIAVAGYEFPHIESGSDANWLSGAVELTVGTTGRFTASHKLWLFTTDLQQFRDELRVLDSELSGEAKLRHLEGRLDLTIKLANGRGTVEGGVGEHVGAELVFEQIPIDKPTSARHSINSRRSSPHFRFDRTRRIRWAARRRCCDSRRRESCAVKALVANRR